MNPSAIRLVLRQEHTHAGRVCRPGESIEVDPASAQWLMSQEIAVREVQPQRSEPDLPQPARSPSTKPDASARTDRSTTSRKDSTS